MTVVVGPNGSGKSNVVDAIGWVLGAQAPSAVRSQKMDDVIFAGTSKLPQLGRAEVSLTIDNSAGLLPIEFTEVTITRLLFRSGDSEYAINGVPCRLLDIQELLSDSGVGRQQHVIISQGQIDAVLNARPEDRRLIIEEAAGVLKFRRRKEKAERRLAATEGNPTRLQDLLREVRRQLRPLEKQADAARRHGDVVAELTALRIHLAGQDLLRLRGRLERGEVTRRSLADDERGLRTRLRGLDADVLATEAKLTAMGGDDLGDALVRYEALRERGRGLAAVLAERRRGLERDRDVSVDEGVVANPTPSAAGDDLAGVEAEPVALRPEADEVRRRSSTRVAPGLQAEGLTAWPPQRRRGRGPASWPGAPVGRAQHHRGRPGHERVADRRGWRPLPPRRAVRRRAGRGAGAEVPQRERARMPPGRRGDQEEAEDSPSPRPISTRGRPAEALALALRPGPGRPVPKRLGAVAGVGTLLDWSRSTTAGPRPRRGRRRSPPWWSTRSTQRRALAELQPGRRRCRAGLDGGRVPSVGGGDVRCGPTSGGSARRRRAADVPW